MATARRKTVAAKKATARKRGGARRKSTAAPKRIINRKKQTARKPRVNRAAEREERTKDRLAEDSKLAQKAGPLVKKGMGWQDIAEKLGVSKARVRAAYNKANLSPKDKIVGTESQVAKKVIAARKDGITWPELRARTGLSGAKLRQMVEAGGGAEPKARAKPAGRKPKAARPARKSAAARKASATKASPRARRSKATVKATEESAPSGRTQGRRARRVANETFLKDVVWDLDSDPQVVADGLVGKTIEVTRSFNGRPVRPSDHKVIEVTDVRAHDHEGRIIEFIDGNHGTRFVSSREITSLK